MKIKKINHGLACRIGNVVYVNKDLYKEEYKELLKNILRHERSHTDSFGMKDIQLDAGGKFIMPKKAYYKFVFTHPKSLTEFLPFGIYEGKVVLNPTFIIIWLIVLSITWYLRSALN